MNCIYNSNYSAASLVNLLAESFSCFRDETTFHGRRVRIYKRAQILVADLWACFNGEGYGEFNDIDKITMFAGKSFGISFQTPFPGLWLIFYRLSNPSDAAPTRLYVILAALGKPHTQIAADT